MNKVYSIGELLIDFMPDRVSALKDVPTFTKAPGGAPANVAATVAILGGQSQFIGQVGRDPFGDYLKATLSDVNVNTETLFQSSEANTALAFVSLNEFGQREFMFYRHPSADMLLKYDQLMGLKIQKDILHFCSVSLIESETKQTHVQLINDFIHQGGIVSFDPNLRFSLWPNKKDLQETVLAFIPKADILKISDEELTFITGNDNTHESIKSLFVGRVKAVIYSEGNAGSTLYLKEYHKHYDGFKVNTIDTTGAGDAFIGAVLFQIQRQNIELTKITHKMWDDIMVFANAVAALTTTKKGAIPSIPKYDVVQTFVSSYRKAE